MNRNPFHPEGVFLVMHQIMVETEPDVSLNVILRNEAPVRFVMVHGLASNARLYDGVAETLAKWGYGSIAIDLRGHGQSSKPSTGYDHATISRDLYAAITALHDEASDYPDHSGRWANGSHMANPPGLAAAGAHRQFTAAPLRFTSEFLRL